MMGVDVTILDKKANLADREDREIADEFMKVFSQQIKVISEVNIVWALWEDILRCFQSSTHHSCADQSIAYEGSIYC